MSEQWFPPSQLAFYFDSNSWAKGTALYLKNEVLSAQLTPEGDDWRVDAEVEGSSQEPYRVTAHLRVSEGGNLQGWRATCTCPVGRMCKHGAALGILVAMQGVSLRDPLAQAGDDAENSEQQIQVRQQRALQQSEYQVRDWLARLQAADAQTGFSLPGKAHEHFLYCLSAATTGQRPVFHLSIKQAVSKPNGAWTKPKRFTSQPLPSDPIWRTCEPGEQGIFDLMKACPATNSFSSYGFQSAVKLQGAAAELLLRLCSSTGRLMWEDGKNLLPLVWSDQPVVFSGNWQAVPAQDNSPEGWRLHMQSAQAGVVHGLNEPPLFVDPEQGTCGLLDTQGLSAEQVLLLTQAPVLPERVAVKFQQQLMDAMGPLPLPPMIEKMPEIRGIAPVGVLHISALPMHLRSEQGLFQAELKFQYADCVGYWSHHQPRVVVGQGAQARMVLRDLDAEREIWDLLDDLGFQLWDDNLLGMPGPDGQALWLDWLESDFAPLRDAGFDVHSREGLNHWLRLADDVHVRMSGQGAEEGVEDTSPWFDLSLGMDIDGQRVNILPWVPEILKALARSGLSVTALDGEQADRVPDHLYLPDLQGPGYVKLPTAKIKPWLSMLMELHGERGHDWDGDSLRLSRLDALRTAASLGEGAVWQGAHNLLALVQQMRGATALAEVPLPVGLQATLRPYQQQGLNWLQFLREHHLAGILADDMGLGKTLQTLAHILTEKQAGRLTQPALIVAPVSLLGNWQREAARFCPDLTTHIHHGLSRHETAQELCRFDVVITAYSLLSRDREMWLEVPWHLLVLDEAQNIKNANTNAAQVVSEIPAVHRLCLSGTPIENHLGELWSQFHFLMPGFLGSQRRFTELFRNPIERQGSTEKMAQLRARITPFMLRRTKDLVASELPPKIETLMPVPLEGQQADLYETIRLGMEKTVREALSTQGLGKSQITILDALLKLRQVCCDPRLLKLSAAAQVRESAKLTQLLDMLPEMVAEGRKILLFSQFTEMLGLIEEALPGLGIPWVKLTGQSKNRDAIIDKFTSGEVPLFLISLKAGGVGLNLPQADTVIHYDPWWNPAVENQATDRAHRIGQTKNVWVVKLVAQGTIEERMLALQERKAQLAQDMYEGAVQRKEPLFGESDLNELLKPLG
ncbi:DEAD/DEAH box helicase [Limnohabitans sp. T6-20]|uniref:DEAD/DEAH box helicase n=1 Tax=Limnohabitans sp. T6-20 TaxID=1100725 RepID=UPI000D361537|nr:DEAD/DEAH box helicase [Limnohabitans sp. T6-20]PUE10503.1 helicase SNF2 [Limnohabitans sp. T6-20]